MKKLLIWDGDETLWNGTIAEGDEPTLPFGRRDMCRELCERGVLQAVASHNNKIDVDSTLHSLGLEEYFLHNQASFDMTKSQMVRVIMSDYDLVNNSDVAFIDDSAFNRGDVEGNLPGVLVLEPPLLSINEHFSKAKYSSEDRLRVRRYKSEVQRKQASKAFGEDHQAFLMSCGIKVKFRHAKKADAVRLADLALRANRMAAMETVLTPEQVVENLFNIHVVEVEDKYGDYGVAGFLFCQIGSLRTITHIRALVVSCRLQGRGIGSVLLGEFINQRPCGHTILAAWAETEYNQGMAALYEWHKFIITRGRQGWVTADKTVEGKILPPPWIELEVEK